MHLFIQLNYSKMIGEPFNVGLSDANLSKKELCEAIKKEIPEFQYVISEIGKDPDQRNYIVSNDKIEATGYQTKVSLKRWNKRTNQSLSNHSSKSIFEYLVMIISRTPYRLSFLVEGTDYNSWYKKNGGLIIAAGLAHYCYITVRELPPFFEHKYRIVYSKMEHVKNISDIDHPSVRACLEYKNILNGLEVHYDGDLPARSGIGSSSSFTVGLLKILWHVLKEKTFQKMK